MRIRQLAFEEVEAQERDDWTFQGEATRSLTHCYHDYPARMIPQVAGKLLDLFALKPGATLFDPYCGTGTSLVEGMVHGYNVIGTDLNPLARLIARSKTALPSLDCLDRTLAQLLALGMQTEDETPYPMELEGIRNPSFWFKPDVFRILARLRSFVFSIEDQQMRDFFAVAFSETVREASNTRRGEFKLYRYAQEDLERHNPDPFALLSAKLSRNRKGLVALQEALAHSRPTASIHAFNTVQGVPEDLLPPKSVDVVLTSPPYGDSQTTVAYGQYSRLSTAWLGLSSEASLDRSLMGGKALKMLPVFPCTALNVALASVAEVDPKRALEVASFYRDLQDSISHIAPLVKSGGNVGYVVGNRKVKGVVLPTDCAVRDFFMAHGYLYVTTFHRNIPNKRMPSRNSPENTQGKTEPTMLCEYIVVLKQT